MKKTIFIIIAITCIVNLSSAQTTEDFREKLMFGMKIGANYSNVYDAQGEAFVADPKFGLAAGAFLSIPIGKYFGIQPELLFSQKGFSATGVILGSAYSFTNATSYIDVPLLFSIKPIQFLTVLAGPQYSYLLKQTYTFDNAKTTIAQQQEFKNANIRKNTLCFTGGVDINIKHVVISGRVGWDIMKNNGDGTTTTPRYKNIWYQATIGFRI